MRRASLLLISGLAAALAHGPASAQTPYRTEEVIYPNVLDSTYLTGTLALPSRGGPFRGVVLMSIAGTDPLVQRLTGLGYAVLVPIRRGFVAVEPLLQATYEDLANDGLAAVDYMRARPDVVDEVVSLIGQGDDAGPAMMAAAASADAIPLVLLGPPGFPGTEVFRQEQHGLAVRQGRRPAELEALDRYIAQIAEIALTERSTYLKEYRLQELISASEIQLPYNAAFPAGADQPHFFASPLWHDRLALDPERVLSRLHGPVLVLIGVEDLDTPIDEYLEAIERGLASATTNDRTVCLLQERTRHHFSDETVRIVGGWLGEGGSSREARCPSDPR
jgi:pimeloyl-ACP methyl ester carboxylesterase